MGGTGAHASGRHVGCCKDVPVELSERRSLSRIRSRVMAESDVLTKGPLAAMRREYAGKGRSREDSSAVVQDRSHGS